MDERLVDQMKRRKDHDEYSDSGDIGERSTQRRSSFAERKGDDHGRYAEHGSHPNEGEMAGWRRLRGVSGRARGNGSKLIEESLRHLNVAGHCNLRVGLQRLAE